MGFARAITQTAPEPIRSLSTQSLPLSTPMLGRQNAASVSNSSRSPGLTSSPARTTGSAVWTA